MAKKEATPKKEKEAKAAPAASPAAKAKAAASFKYGVEALATKLGVKAASARVALRNNKIPKAEGGVYGWNSQADLEAVVAKLKPAPKEAKAAAPKAEKKAKKTA